MDNEQIVRKVYELAEVKDYPGFVACSPRTEHLPTNRLGVLIAALRKPHTGEDLRSGISR